MVLVVIVLIFFSIQLFKIFLEQTDESNQNNMLTGSATSSASVTNVAPNTDNITTYVSYISSTDLRSETNFTICDNEDSETIFIQINVKDNNSIPDIIEDGSVTFIILLLNGSNESTFVRFGTDPKTATLELGSGITGTYTASFDILQSDPERVSPLAYRIKTNVSDGIITTSNNQSVDFTFMKETCDGFSNDSINLIDI